MVLTASDVGTTELSGSDLPLPSSLEETLFYTVLPVTYPDIHEQLLKVIEGDFVRGFGHCHLYFVKRDYVLRLSHRSVLGRAGGF